MIIAPLKKAARALLRARTRRQRLHTSLQAFSRNQLVPRTPDRNYLSEIDKYWRENFGRSVNPTWQLACTSVIGEQDVRYIPHDMWRERILPAFNRMEMRPTYFDKNLADILLQGPTSPPTVIKRMHGEYYDGRNRWLRRNEALQELLASKKEELILKGSRTDDGVNIRSLRISTTDLSINNQIVRLEDLERTHGRDFLVQERITQSPVMAAPHPASVNTARLVTFRWKDQIRVLLAFARFGVEGKMTDNAGTGGVCCRIGSDGKMDDRAIDEYGTTHLRHPTSGYEFSECAYVPNYDQMCREAIELHKRIFHSDIVSWDFATNVDGSPVFLEMNFQGVSYIYQFASRKPIFGDLTREVLQYVRDHRPYD